MRNSILSGFPRLSPWPCMTSLLDNHRAHKLYYCGEQIKNNNSTHTHTHTYTHTHTIHLLLFFALQISFLIKSSFSVLFSSLSPSIITSPPLSLSLSLALSLSLYIFPSGCSLCLILSE